MKKKKSFVKLLEDVPRRILVLTQNLMNVIPILTVRRSTTTAQSVTPFP